MNRGNQRQALYRTDEDYHTMLACLAEATERWGARIHGYCLMTNHFHLLLQVQEVSVSTIMRCLLRKYAWHFNQAHHTVGHVFQGRFRSTLCDKEAYLLELLRYLHLNPVRAGLVDQPQQWRWSSLPAYLGRDGNDWLYKRDVLELFGRQPQQKLLQFLTQEPSLNGVNIYPAEDFPILGTRVFTQMAVVQSEPRRRRKRLYTGPKLSLEHLAEILCEKEKFPVRYLCVSRKGDRKLTGLREKFVYAAIRILFHKPAEVARFLGVSPCTLSFCLRRFSKRLEAAPELEEALHQWITENLKI
jgi:REP element-mobilizing transposase RayT